MGGDVVVAVEDLVMVRPRAGGFAYDADEVALMVADTLRAVAAGAHGIVIGGTRDGRVDPEIVRPVLDAAGDVPVSFHRAFDTLADQKAGLDELAELGVIRVLTAAGASRAVDALDGLRALVEHAAGRIQVMAGGGIDPSNVAEIVATGVDGIHASAKGIVIVSDAVAVSLGTGAPAGEGGYETTDEATAMRLREILRGA
ncbi:copper homeostasis protein CutC [Microbacterium sp. Root53]|uniref:copper homeostasis protein CutC n=1 Tax=Microbacterium sp. Root53 TaxID=1736553 RepID=UPI0009EBFFF2|nr:copper homeostasis protein CutC [Microbacterium sp. Root53]